MPEYSYELFWNGSASSSDMTDEVIANGGYVTGSRICGGHLSISFSCEADAIDFYLATRDRDDMHGDVENCPARETEGYSDWVSNQILS